MNSYIKWKQSRQYKIIMVCGKGLVSQRLYCKNNIVFSTALAFELGRRVRDRDAFLPETFESNTRDYIF